MGQVDCVCLGRVITEYMSEQTASNPEEIPDWQSFIGGTAANLALDLARLNVSTTLLGCVGNDTSADWLLTSLMNAGVNVSGIRRVSAPTGWVYTLRTTTGDRQFFHPDMDFARLADAQLLPEHVESASFDKALCFAPQSVPLGPHDSRIAVYRALEIAREKQVYTVFDVNYRPFAWANEDEARLETGKFAAEVDYLKATEEEAAWLCGESSTRVMTQKYPGLKGVLITRGEKGCDYSLHGNSGHVPAFQVKAVDPTGAGDAFLAAFIFKLINSGQPILDDAKEAREIVRFANAAGALCVTQLGANASFPRLSEIEALLTSQLGI